MRNSPRRCREQLSGLDVVNQARGGLLSVLLVPTVGSLLMIRHWKLPPLNRAGTPIERSRAALLQ